MKSVIAMGLAIGLLFGAGQVQGEESLDGEWTLSSGEVNGKVLSEKQLEGGKLTIKGDQYSVTVDGKTSKGVQKLDAKPKLKTIDIKDSSGPNKDKPYEGIYEIKGDEFRVVFAATGKPRPSKFSTSPDSGHWMHVWKRAKP